MKREIWKDVPGYEGYYQISNIGRVRSLDRIVSAVRRGKLRYQPVKGQILKQGVARTKGGYFRVVLQKEAKQRYVQVHVLVLEAFAGKKPPGLVCAHENGNPQDNRIENLSYKTHRENVADRFRHGRGIIGERVNTARLTERQVMLIRNAFENDEFSIDELAEQYDVHTTTIRYAIKRKSWKHLP